MCFDWCVGQPTCCISLNDCSRSWKVKFLLSVTSSTWKLMSPIIMLVLFNLSPGKSQNSSTNLKPVSGLTLEYGGLFTIRVITVFVPIFICHCENSKVTCLPLLTNDGLYLSLYIMPVPPPFLSSLGMFLKQYPTFLNLFMLSQSSSFTHVSVRYQKSTSSSIQWCNITSSFLFIDLRLQIAILTQSSFL